MDATTPSLSQALSLKQQREAMRDGKLLGLECDACRRRHFTPVARCTCGSMQLHVTEFAREGVVESFTVQIVAPEAFLNEVPFAWALIQLDGGPRVSGWIPFVSRPEDLKVGDRVRFTPSYKPGMMFEKVPTGS